MQRSSHLRGIWFSKRTWQRARLFSYASWADRNRASSFGCAWKPRFESLHWRCCKTLAMNGYIAFCAWRIILLGGYPGNDDDGRAMQSSMDKAKIEDFIVAAMFIKSHANSSGKLGAVGFCLVAMWWICFATMPDALMPEFLFGTLCSWKHSFQCQMTIVIAVCRTWPASECYMAWLWKSAGWSNKVPYTAHV